MTLSGVRNTFRGTRYTVLIPLLVDVPLWALKSAILKSYSENVLIPLLVDVPLWDFMEPKSTLYTQCLNPSFSGCPALGIAGATYYILNNTVLIPLLVDVPLWDSVT